MGCYSQRGAKSEPATASLERCGEANRGEAELCWGAEGGVKKGRMGTEEKADKLASQGIPETAHGKATASLLRTGVQEPLQGEAGDRYE